MRFNHAPVDGYATDVGNKTTIRVVNSQVNNSNYTLLLIIKFIIIIQLAKLKTILTYIVT